MRIETRELTPDCFPLVERLFGENGACGGCWCMAWRLEKGDKWENVKGAQAKRRFKALVASGKAHGILAFVDGEPVGWCSFDRRPDYFKLDRAPSLACEDAASVWSVPCFFVKSAFRGKGVAGQLLDGALEALRRHGAKIVEGYPVKPRNDNSLIPAAFAWTGTRGLFESRGFKIVGNPDGGKQRMRREV